MKRATAVLVFGLAPVLVAAALGTASLARAEPEIPPSFVEGTAPLNRTIGLSLRPGEEIAIRGSVRTSFDGTVFDAATRTDTLPSGTATRADGLFDAVGGGLTVVASDPLTHAVRLVATGAEGPGCRAAGVASPCLVPRARGLAHERLLTETEFIDTLTGRIEVVALKPPPIFIAPTTRHTLSIAAFALAAALFSAIGIHFARARRKSALGQVRVFARTAKKATRTDGTLAAVSTQIDDLVVRAEHLDEARRACIARLAKIDRGALERKRAAYASSTAPDAAETLAWVSAECAEAARLDADLASSINGLEKIASALRVIALHARAGRGTRTRIGTDPTGELANELRMRDEALEETEEATARVA